MSQLAVIPLRSRKVFRKSISVVTSRGIFVIRVDEIVRIQADRSYCFIHTTQGKKILASKSLKDFEDALPMEDFARVHTSHIVNIHQIDYYKQGEGGFIHCTNGDVIPVARRRKQNFLGKLNFV